MRIAVIIAALAAATPAMGDRAQGEMLCITAEGFLAARPTDGVVMVSVGTYLRGLAAGVEIAEPGAKGEYESVIARLEAVCENMPLAVVQAVLARFVREARDGQ